MTDERFNQLLRQLCTSPMHPLNQMHLALALRQVVEWTGTPGERALEEFCRAQQEKDDWQFIAMYGELR